MTTQTRQDEPTGGELASSVPPAGRARWRRLATAAKFIVPLLFVAWLVIDVPQRDPEVFERLREHQKDWRRLAFGGILVLVATCVTFVRWFLLVRGLDLPFRMGDAFRLGFLGCIFNFVSLGNAGGDLFKTVVLAREQRSRWPEALASVVIDRVVGLYGLLLVASAAVMVLRGMPGPVMILARGILLLTMLATAGLLLVLLIPDISRSHWVRRVLHVRRIGPILERLLAAVISYRQHKKVLAVSIAMSLSVHVLIALGIFFGATGLFERTPTVTEHLVISPLAGAAGALPIAPAGLGTFESALAYLYGTFQGASSIPRGLVVALCYRLMTVAIAVVGAVYYVGNRKWVRETMARAERRSIAKRERTAE